MIYACEECGFLFYRVGEVKECPACEKNRLRPANKEEIRQLQSFLNQPKTNPHIKEGKST